VGAVRIFDSELATRLVLHEAQAQQTPSRELRDLGDGWLFHDPSDAEPFWNRIIAPRWPADEAAFARRLDEITTLFATLARLPHVRPLPIGSEPSDMAQRLVAAGFERLGADRRLVLVEPDRARSIVAAWTPGPAASLGGTLTVSRYVAGNAGRGPDRRQWASDASSVLEDAFGVPSFRRSGLESDVLACLSRPGCSVLLLRINDEPVAIARRSSTADGSYLSSIGTRRDWRNRGLGALATALAVTDALAEGAGLVHLAVEDDNGAARRLYERLGFAVVGEATPDLLLR